MEASLAISRHLHLVTDALSKAEKGRAIPAAAGYLPRDLREARVGLAL
jgi:hypothetical protein